MLDMPFYLEAQLCFRFKAEKQRELAKPCKSSYNFHEVTVVNRTSAMSKLNSQWRGEITSSHRWHCSQMSTSENAWEGRNYLAIIIQSSSVCFSASSLHHVCFSAFWYSSHIIAYNAAFLDSEILFLLITHNLSLLGFCSKSQL